ncbi:MAG: permease-like cell division protein FtsX [Gemmatimonadetes bacterium]|nr:permease-like cell division protein FtsX [Gemmatimonadota bacterium]
MHYILRETVTSLYRSPILTVLSISMISLALYILGLFALGTYNFYLVLNDMEERIQIVAYLRDVATVEDISDLRDILNTLPEVSATQLVTKEEALAKANNELPEFREIFSELRNNPLPASLEIQLVAESRTPEGTNNVVSHIESHPIVEGIEYGQEWVSTFFALSRIAGAATLLFGVAFSIAASLIIGTAVKINVVARKKEIEIMQLVGAQGRFIMYPFLLEGALTGIIGGAGGVILTYLTGQVMSRYVFSVNWLPFTWVLIGMISTLGLGIVTSIFSVRRQLQKL